jgi:hypothetical protein
MEKCINCKKRQIFNLKRKLCERCTKYLYRTGKNAPPNIRKINPKFSGSLRKDGYISILINGRRKLQHTLTMEKFIGRELYKNESIHHKNGVRNDNRIENLELWTNNQPSGQRVEDKINWAVNFLNLYGFKIER